MVVRRVHPDVMLGLLPSVVGVTSWCGISLAMLGAGWPVGLGGPSEAPRGPWNILLQEGRRSGLGRTGGGMAARFPETPGSNYIGASFAKKLHPPQ